MKFRIARNLALPLIAAPPAFLKDALAQTAADLAPWDELKSELTSPDSLQAGSIAAWQDQCVPPFADENFPDPEPLVNSSNYDLFQQPSGQCMAHLSCAYENCTWPFEPVNAYDPDNNLQQPELFDLPAQIIHPLNVGDIVKAIKFAATHGVGLSVKTSGHSYVGASTRKGTLLINMAKYPKYSIDDSTEPPLSLIVECKEENTISSAVSAMDMACNLATARGKGAFLRAGGGEIWDEPLRSVWYWNLVNENENNNKYHIVTGAAGTVSAAGGWLASGGLSGTTGMRMYGIGVDQVLHVEMVLPDGTHVRFGPSEWVDEEGFMYPKTTAVSGFCNAMPEAADEANWQWGACSKDINFKDLWFAVRGGGGGTYGVVTSIYYQLHDRPGPLKVGSISPRTFDDNWEQLSAERLDIIEKIASMHLDFHIDFFFNPNALNVTEKDSLYLGSPVFATSPFLLTLAFGYDGATDVWASAWAKYFEDNKQELLDLGLAEERIVELISWVDPGIEQPAYGIPSEAQDAGVPAGRIADIPRPYVRPTASQFTNFWHVPTDKLINEREKLIPIVIQVFGLGSYVLGGHVADAHDQMTAIPDSRRRSGFLMPFPDEATASLLEVLYGDEDDSNNGSFPGIMCHNHFGPDAMGPMKTDWTKPCPPSATAEERKEQCISQQEGVYGTELLADLEEIKRSVDPKSLFVCAGGIRYDASTPTEATTPSGASYHIGVFGSCLSLIFVLFTTL